METGNFICLPTSEEGTGFQQKRDQSQQPGQNSTTVLEPSTQSDAAFSEAVSELLALPYVDFLIIYFAYFSLLNPIFVYPRPLVIGLHFSQISIGVRATQPSGLVFDFLLPPSNNSCQLNFFSGGGGIFLHRWHMQ